MMPGSGTLLYISGSAMIANVARIKPELTPQKLVRRASVNAVRRTREIQNYLRYLKLPRVGRYLPM